MKTEIILRLSLLIIDGFLMVGIIYIGRQLRKIRVLMEQGTDRIREYVAVVLSQEESDAPTYIPEEERRQATEEKKMLFSFDPESVLNEFMGDIL
ncbi:MAG: hypothetical protein E7280_04535 [Lachnospiraceae bacterium]|jgi:hypothetical protein|nr:hypothetical protein [Lachnospiraceae bacterium]